MSTTPGFEPEALEALRAAAGSPPAAPPVPSPTPPPPPARSGPRSAEARVKDVVRRGIDRVLGGYIRGVSHQAVADATDQLQRLAARLERLLDTQEELAALPANFELLKGEVGALHATTVNLDLLKAEVRGVQATLDELGWALAPGGGLANAGARVAELREKVNAVERRLRHQGGAPRPSAAADAAPGAALSAPAAPAASPSSELFDYVGFERRFRGDPEVVVAALRERYGAELAAHQPVADLGCGRGELLAALAADGVQVVGCDTDSGMVAEATARGLEVVHADAVQFLRERPEASLGSIIATHVFEHLELDYLIELLELAATRLVPGGILVAETPNPASLVVLGNSYILDPTHVRPLHPSLLTFLCEGAGFRDVHLRFYSPAVGYHLPHVDAGDDAPGWVATVNEAFDKLNQTVFGPQEYAVVATTPTT